MNYLIMPQANFPGRSKNRVDLFFFLKDVHYKWFVFANTDFVND